MEDPGYPRARVAFQSAQLDVTPIPVDSEGLNSAASSEKRSAPQMRYQVAAEMRSDLLRLKRDTDTGRPSEIAAVNHFREALMIIEHEGHTPNIDKSAYVAPNATICGNVSIGPGTRIMFGSCVVAEGAPVTIGQNCIIMENVVIRSTHAHAARIGSHCLVGPNSHLVGCTVEDCVFIATGVAIFHGAEIGYAAEVRVNAVVHLKTRLPKFSVVPIAWVTVGDPASILSPDRHDAIWAIQKPLDFPRYVYNVSRPPDGTSNMQEITKRRSELLGSHVTDRVVTR